MKDLTQYKAWLDLNCSKKSAISFLTEVKVFFNQYEEMTQENIDAFFTSNIDKWKPKTWNNYIYRLNKYAQFNKLDIKFHKRRTDNHDIKGYLQEKEVIEIAENSRLFTQDGTKNRAIILTLFYTGLRPKELCNLKKLDIDFSKKEIVIKNTKNHLDRIIPMDNDLTKLLSDVMHYDPQNEYVFSENNQSLQYLCKKINEYMKPSVPTYPYIFRHSFAHDCLKKSGNNVKLVSKIMGHSSLEITNLYLNINQNEACNEYRKCIMKSKKRKY